MKIMRTTNTDIFEVISEYYGKDANKTSVLCFVIDNETEGLDVHANFNPGSGMDLEDMKKVINESLDKVCNIASVFGM